MGAPPRRAEKTRAAPRGWGVSAMTAVTGLTAGECGQPLTSAPHCH